MTKSGNNGDSKIRICFCIDSMKTGGAERLLVELINRWSCDEWKIYLVTFSPQNAFSHILKKNKICKHMIFPFNSSRTGAILRMYRFCKTEKINVVLSHLERSNKWLSTGARISGAKVAIVVHNINIYDNIPFYRHTGIRYLYNTVPHKIIAVSDSVRDYLVSMKVNPTKLDVILNGVDYQGLQGKYEVKPCENKLCLGVLGRLEKVKGLDVLLNALSVINAEREWSLVVVGEGSCRKELENQAKRLKIAEKVRFLGMQSEPLKYLVNCSAICIPSYREGLPLALLECMSIGLPAVVSDVGYLPKIVKSGINGLTCKPGSVESLVRVLRHLASLDTNKWKLFSKQARASASRYDIQRCVSRYENQMKKLLSGKKR